MSPSPAPPAARLTQLLSEEGLAERLPELVALARVAPDAWAEVQPLAVFLSVVAEPRALRDRLAELLLEGDLDEAALGRARQPLDVFLRAHRTNGLPGFQDNDPEGFAGAWAAWRRPGVHDRFTPALLAHPRLAMWLLELARALRFYGRTEDAIALSLQLAETWRRHRCWTELGEAASLVSQHGLLNDARPELTPVVLDWLAEIADESEDVRPWATVMAGYLVGFKGGDVEGGCRWYRRAIAAAPEHPAPYNDLAWLLTSNGRLTEEALGYARAALARAPGNPSVQHTAGLLEWRVAQDPDTARRLLEQAAAHPKAEPQYAASLAELRAAHPAPGGGT